MQHKLSFRSVLLRNEYGALKGRNNSTIGYLFVILFITFIAFGFAKSTLTYQRKLASDPFSTWINMDFHAGTRDSLKSLHDKINDEQFKLRFHIKEAFFYNKGMVSVLPFSRGKHAILVEARTIDPQSDIVLSLLKTGLIARYCPDSTCNVFRHEPNGVIISLKLLEALGLDKETLSFIQLKSPMGDFIPVPVLAVIMELPDGSDIIYTNLFYCKSMNQGFYDCENPYYRIFIENMDTAEVLNTLWELYKVLDIRDPATVQTTILKTGNTKVLNWKIEIGTQENQLMSNARDERIAAMVSLKNHHYGQYFVLSNDSTCDNSSFFHDYLAIEFMNLEKISDFAKYLKRELNLQLSLEVLSERENYLYTVNIAAGAIILLMLLSIISVSIYLSSIIRNHLIRIKKNLGNFLAFGVKNSTLIWLYLFISMKILFIAAIPAFMIAYVCGELFEKYLLGEFLVIDPNQNYFSLFTPWFAAFLGIILIVAILRAFISVKKILKQTPGDLIYERDQ